MRRGFAGYESLVRTNKIIAESMGKGRQGLVGGVIEHWLKGFGPRVHLGFGVVLQVIRG